MRLYICFQAEFVNTDNKISFFVGGFQSTMSRKILAAEKVFKAHRKRQMKANEERRQRDAAEEAALPQSLFDAVNTLLLTTKPTVQGVISITKAELIRVSGLSAAVTTQETWNALLRVVNRESDDWKCTTDSYETRLVFEQVHPAKRAAKETFLVN